MSPSPVSAVLDGCLVEPCRSLARQASLGVSDLRALAERIELDAAALAALAIPDPKRPYGRRVLLATDTLEVMVATWTRGVPCAPHDHGGSVGVVKVLQGRSRHRLWGLQKGRLVEQHVEVVDPGGIMICDTDVIHSMGDDEADLPLLTLHLYTTSIDYMVVYEHDRTHVVEGSCGAWVPHDQPQLIRRSLPGILLRHQLPA